MFQKLLNFNLKQLKFSEYLQNISRSKGFGKLVLIVKLLGWLGLFLLVGLKQLSTNKVMKICIVVRLLHSFSKYLTLRQMDRINCHLTSIP